MKISINITDSRKHARFRQIEEINFLKEMFGPDLGKEYFKGFMQPSEYTLVAKEKNEVVASARLRFYGGTLQVSELVSGLEMLPKIFQIIEVWAYRNRVHKIWLIDHPKLKRTKIFGQIGFEKECGLKKNVYRQDEVLFSKKLNENGAKPALRGIKAKIIKGKRLTRWREKRQLEEIKFLLGGKAGEEYFRGFRGSKNFTLEILDGKRLVGSAEIQIFGGVFTIEAFIIKKQYRGKGLGSMALASMEKKAKELGCHKMQLITNPKLRAVGLYSRNGWMEEGVMKDNIVRLDEVIMCKFID